MNKQPGTRIGLFGGTFNPIHLGHLLVAQAVLERFHLERIVFIPVAFPPHKRPADLAASLHRLRMVRLATRGNPRFDVSDVEIRRGGTSYTVDTVTAFQKCSQGSLDLFFIIGADSLPQLHRWRRIRDLLRHCRMIVVPRPGISFPPRVPAVRRALGHSWDRIVFADVDVLDISSEAIRRMVRARKDIAYLVTRPVAEYIKRYELY